MKIINPSLKQKIMKLVREEIILQNIPEYIKNSPFPRLMTPNTMIIAEKISGLTTEFVGVSNKEDWKKLALAPYKVIRLFVIAINNWQLITETVIKDRCIACLGINIEEINKSIYFCKDCKKYFVKK